MANHHNIEDDNRPAPFGQPKKPEDLAAALAERYAEMRKHHDAMTPQVEIGATGDYPAGMYGPGDEGGLQFAIGSDSANERVFLEFGKPVANVAMEPEQAIHLAQHLITHARKASRRKLSVELFVG